MGKSYQDLVAWQKAMDLVANVYELSRGFPKEEVYGLTSQLRRAAVSVPINIAEAKADAVRQSLSGFFGLPWVR